MNEKFQDFWKRLSSDKHPNMINFELNINVIFASGYLCQSTFSNLKRMKPETCNRLNEYVLHACLRLSTTEQPLQIARKIRPALSNAPPSTSWILSLHTTLSLSK